MSTVYSGAQAAKQFVLRNFYAISGIAAIFLLLYFFSLKNYVLHGAVEIFGVIIAFTVFTIARNSRKEEELRKTSNFNKTLLDTIPFAIDIVDEEGNILFMSEKFEKKFGALAIGKKCWELYKDDKKQCEKCPLKKGVAIGRTEDIETYGAFGGKIFKIVHTGMVFKGKKAVMEIFRDITEQKSMEKVTEESRVYAENIVDTIREPLVVLDAGLKVVSANWFFYYTFRFLKENTVDRPFFEIYDHYWDIPALKERLMKVVGQNASFHDFEIDHIFSASGSRTMIFSARQIYQTGQAEPRVLLVIMDTTGRKRAEEAMRASEKKYRYLFDNASDAILTIDMEDKILSWNKGAEIIFGWKQEEVAGRKFPDLMVPADLKKARKNIIDGVWAGKTLTGVETVRKKKDGTKINVGMTLSPLINEKKEIIGLSAVIRDITARKQDEQKLKLHARKLERLTSDLEKFKLAVENVSEHVVITDAEGAVLYANRGAEDITGYSAKEMIGKKAGGKSLWGGLMSEKFYQDLWKTIGEDKKIFIGELTNKRKSGEKYIAEIRVSPILDASGKVVFFAAVERDITKEKEIDLAKTEFVSMASHQLRTPLANMSLSLEMVLDGIAGEIGKDQKKYLKGVYRDIRGMAGLIDALLNVSRIELRTLVIEPEPTDLKEIAELVLREFAPEIKKKNLEVKTMYEKFLPIVNIDRNLTRIILQNLFSNAIKYTPAGGTITSKIGKDGKNAIIEVADTGFGIPADQQQKIFSKMFRARNAIDSKNEGIGLGLYIVKSIVEQFGGRIWFESPGPENKGTAFYVSVPLEGMKKQA